ncbi:CPBP family intramembrane metalloprotease [Massilia sp. DJPM01]|uniref:CPBP family intramembrane glutamic endopeptidase n=1 Tax=Massilia sp. DJPM01 TaxID=3024404 RepID=UPI00259EDA8E|nr:CPBP family intramembrane glutamic endopeptidase [Massilia sp. DJPM01]MDM5179849.1 CPBP family intramembrane metalloprotease [Massilia sp. DJPM01]
MKFKILFLILTFSMIVRTTLFNVLSTYWRDSTYYAEHVAIIAMFVAMTVTSVIQFGLNKKKLAIILGKVTTPSHILLSITVAVLLLMLTFGESAAFTLSLAQYNIQNAYDLGKFHAETYDSHSFFSPPILVFIFSSVILPAIFEEIFFRGLVFRSLYKEHSFFKSAVWTAVFFTSVHFLKPVYISTFLFSLVLSYLYAATRSLPSCMIAHATFNFLAFINQHYFDFHRIRDVSQISHLHDWIPQFAMLGFSLIAFSLLVLWFKDAIKQAALPQLPSTT